MWLDGLHLGTMLFEEFLHQFLAFQSVSEVLAGQFIKRGEFDELWPNDNQIHIFLLLHNRYGVDHFLTQGDHLLKIRAQHPRPFIVD